MAYNTDAVLDAPDLTVRKIMQKRADGAALTDKEYKRLAARTGAEAQLGKEGGTVKQAVNPKPLTPYEQGAQDREYQDGYNGGRAGTQSGSPQENASGQQPPAAASGAPAAAPGGGINVRGYAGSMWAKPGSYAAPRSIAPAAQPAGAEAPAAGAPPDALARKKKIATPTTAAPAAGPMSLGAFGQIKPRPIAPPVTSPTINPVSPSPLRGNVAKLTAAQIASARRPGGAFSKPPLRLP